MWCINSKFFKSALMAVMAVLSLSIAPQAVQAQSRPSIAVGEPMGPARYVVRTGDTIYSIARNAGVPVEVLLRLNPGLDIRYLRVGDVVVVPSRPGPVVAHERITVTPGRGSVRSLVEIRGSGFRPMEPLRLLAGPGAYDLELAERMKADRNGRVVFSTELPRWARPGSNVFFALQSANQRRRVVSEPFRVTGRRSQDLFRMSGTLISTGAECPVMRGDDGKVYSLAGEVQDFGRGDRVFVEGRAVEVSICMRGATIDVRRIRSAD
jgi:LysM repeat protein